MSKGEFSMVALEKVICSLCFLFLLLIYIITEWKIRLIKTGEGLGFVGGWLTVILVW